MRSEAMGLASEHEPECGNRGVAAADRNVDSREDE